MYVFLYRAFHTILHVRFFQSQELGDHAEKHFYHLLPVPLSKLLKSLTGYKDMS